MKKLISLFAVVALCAPAVHAQQGPVEINDSESTEKPESQQPSKTVDVDAAAKRVDHRLKKDAKTIGKFFGIGGKDKKAPADDSEETSTREE